MDAVQLRGSSQRLSYIKRFGAFLFAAVLCVTMMFPAAPKARALLGEAALAGSILSPAASSLGGMILAGVGVNFQQGYVAAGNKSMYGTATFVIASELDKAIRAAGGTIASWWNDTVAATEAAGGWVVGQVVHVPAEVAEFARTWVRQRYDFSSGAVSFSQSGIVCRNNFILFTQFSSPVFDAWSAVSSVGTFINPAADSIATYFFSDSSGSDFTYEFRPEFVSTTKLLRCYTTASGTRAAAVVDTTNSNRFFTFAAIPLRNPDSSSQSYLYLVPAVYNKSDGTVLYGSGYLDNAVPSNYLRVDDKMQSIVAIVSSVPEKIAVPVTKEMVVKAPAKDYTEVEGVTIPVVDSLTYTDVLTEAGAGEGEGTGTLTGTMVGDISLDDINAKQKDLGAVFITKFPFCIPWDLAKAVGLLASPPVTPHWTVDFLAPLSGRVGGWRGSTTIDIDMGDYAIVGTVCRWVFTILFCGALAGATKRLIWT